MHDSYDMCTYVCLYNYVHMQGSNLDAVTADSFKVMVGGQICSELSVQETQVYMTLYNAMLYSLQNLCKSDFGMLYLTP